MDARLLREEEYYLWDALAAESPYGSVFDESRWFGTVAAVMGGAVDVVGVFDAGHLVGGCVVERSGECGVRTATLPPLCPTNSCVIAPPRAKSPAKVERHILSVTEALARFLQSQFGLATVANCPAMNDIRSFRWLGWRANVLYTHRVDLQSIELNHLSKSRRRAIRKAAKADLVVDTYPDPETMHSLLAKTSRRHGFRSPVSEAQLVRLCNSLGEDLWWAVARFGETRVPLAGYLSVIDRTRGVAYGLLAGFDDEHGHTHASSFLEWHEIMTYKEQGLKILDLGGADVEANAEFKSDFEGQLTPYYEVSYSSLRYRLSRFVCRAVRRWLLPGG